MKTYGQVSADYIGRILKAAKKWQRAKTKQEKRQEVEPVNIKTPEDHFHEMLEYIAEHKKMPVFRYWGLIRHHMIKSEIMVDSKGRTVEKTAAEIDTILDGCKIMCKEKELVYEWLVANNHISQLHALNEINPK